MRLNRPRGYLAMSAIESHGFEPQHRSFFSNIGILESTLDLVARYGIEFPCVIL